MEKETLSNPILWSASEERVKSSEMFRFLRNINEKYNLNIEWKKASLEKGKHDSLSEIEKIAQSHLKMIAPKKREFININE